MKAHSNDAGQREKKRRKEEEEKDRTEEEKKKAEGKSNSIRDQISIMQTIFSINIVMGLIRQSETLIKVHKKVL